MADLKDVIDKLENEGTLVRNKGAHSIRSVKEIMQESQESPAERKQKLEDSRNAADKTNTLLESIASGVSVSSGGASEAKKSGKLGGLLGGIGGALGGLGIGVGAAMGGLGALFAGGGYLLKQLAEFDGKAVVANVRELFKIADLTTGIGNAFSQGGQFLISMVGIGLGLAVFGAGAAIASAGGALSKFLDPKWAETIVKNVVILLGISKTVGGSAELLKKGGAFFLAMTGIGLGLAVFGTGAAVAGLAGALTNFIDKTWAQGIVDNVVILLSIKDKLGGNANLLASGGAFFLAMAGIGAGLAVFGVGAALTGLAQFIVKDDWATRLKNSVVTLLSIKDALGGNANLLVSGGAFFLAMAGIGAGLAAFSAGQTAAGFTQFISKEDWAQKIKDSVKTLMGIADLKFGDVAKFAVFMTAVAAGLVAFAVGKGANAMGDVIGKFTGNFAVNIVKDVNTLMAMINDPNVNQKKANEFSSIMGTIAAGLVKFSAGKFIGTLASAAAGVVGFLTGAKSPIQEIRNIAKEADNIEKGANAIGKVSDNLKKIGSLKFDGSDINIKDFSKDLLDSVPAIEAAIMGGKIKGGVFSSDIKYKGLASTEIKWSDAAKNIRTIQAALKVDPAEEMDSTAEDIAGATNSIFETLKRSIDELTAQIALIPVGGNTVNAPTNVKNEGDVVATAPVVNTRYGGGLSSSQQNF